MGCPYWKYLPILILESLQKEELNFTFVFLCLFINTIRITIVITIFKSIITTIITTIVVVVAAAIIYVAVFSNFIVYKLFLVF